MIKTKFVFAVSLVAMLAVGSAWASAPGKNESVDTAHTVYTDQSPTSTEVEGGTAIAGVTYVNRAVNKAGAAATAAEAHAAAAGKSALAAAESATQAASSAKSANDTLAGKQDKLTTTNIKGSGSVTVAISNGVITVSGTDNNTTYSTGTATTSGLTKLYTSTGTNADGTMTQAALKKALDDKLSTSGTAAKATADASGNNIVNTYATKAQFDSLGNKHSELVNSVNELKTGKQDALTETGSANRPVYAIDGGVAAVTGMSIPYGKEFEPTSWATIWVE